MRHRNSHIRAIERSTTRQPPDEMRKMLLSAPLALAVLGAIATAASATVFPPYGDRTTSTPTARSQAHSGWARRAAFTPCRECGLWRDPVAS
jgi:hypothetical protein